MARLGAFTTPLDGDRLTARILVNRAYGDVDNPYDAALLWRGSAGFAPRLRFRPAAADLRPPPALEAEDEEEGEEFPGLRALIEAHPYTRYEQLDGETADAAARALPFEHIVLSTRAAGQQMLTVENNLRQAYEQAFGALSARPPRIAFFQDPLAPDSVRLRVQFGFGVFLPEDDARPEGAIELAPASPMDETPGRWSPLRLGDPEGERPAALYRGQSGLAFSSALRHAPAVAEPGLLPEDHVFFFGRFSDEDAPGFRIRPVGPARFDAARAYSAEVAPPDPQDPGETLVAIRDASGRAEAYCRIRTDDRVGGLSRRPPVDRPHFSFEGLILPETGAFSAIRRWWIDFTRLGRLSAAPLDERAWAVASGPHGRFGSGSGAVARLYNRAKHDEAGLFDEGDELRLGPRQTLFNRPLRHRAAAPSGAAGRSAGSGLLEDARRLWRIRLQAREALGYIALGGADRQFVTPRRSDLETALNLDWLDACAGATLPGRTLTGLPETVGLASWSLAHAGVRMTRIGGADIELVADRGLAIARLADGDALEPYAPGTPALFAPGDDLVIGCHHFRYVGATGGR